MLTNTGNPMSKDRQKEIKLSAERMRRTRINKSLEELKLALFGSSSKDIKMEQAEILEYSVEYLKLIQSKGMKHQEEFVLSLREPPFHSSSNNDESHSRKRKRREIHINLASKDVVCVKTNNSTRKLVKRRKLDLKNIKTKNLNSNSVYSCQERLYNHHDRLVSTRKPFGNLSNKIDNKPCVFWRPW